MSFSETWDSVSDDEANESAFKDREVDQIPDGIYQLKIVRFDYFTTEKGEFHKWGFEVAGGIMAGKYVEKFGSEHPVSIKILKQDLRMVTGRIPQAGEVFDGHETGPIKGELLGKVIDAKKVTKKGYSNIYINGVASGSYADTKAQGGGYYRPEAPPLNDSDVPF
tara:strand:- start:177 stop:671 length:495 start_codon:yes stop_codon:yes gene_type:complete